MRDLFESVIAQRADDVALRLLELPQARGLALDALVRLASVDWDEGVQSACVECTATPRLLLNPRFVAERCTSTSKLAFLLLHELGHVSLGHTGLHARVSAAQNIAFDAVINAQLLHGLASNGPTDEWAALVNELYSASEVPLFILRPPPGWPKRPRWQASAGAPEALRDIHHRLYGGRTAWGAPSDERWGSVTYGEIISALASSGFAGDAMSEVSDGDDSVLLGRLLGGHGRTEAERMAESGGRDTQLAEVMGAVLKRLPRDPAGGAGAGGNPFDVRIGRAEADKLLVAALRRLLVSTLLGESDRKRFRQEATPVWTVDSSRDRRAAVRRHAARALGASAPRLFRGESTRLRPIPEGSTAIYLDVSGSMSGVLEPLHASLVPLRRLIAPKVYVFSTVVEEVSREKFLNREVRTTGGTDVEPALRHLAAEARAGRVRRAVLLTDGVFCSPSADSIEELRASGAELHLGVMGTALHAGEAWVSSTTQLPDLTYRPMTERP